MTGQVERDDSGRNRLYSNVLAGWLAHTVTVVIGFVMPRLMYESVGQLTLGIWDLGWSLVSYIAYSGLGMASAVTHYVARYRAEGNELEVKVTTATAWYCQMLLAVLAGSAFFGFFAFLPLWLPGLEQAPADDLWWMGGLLGLTIVIALVGDTAQGMLIGCHRSSTNEVVTIASDVTLALFMIIVLLGGGGLVGLAAATLCTRAAFEVVRLVFAARVCSEASLSLRHWSKARAGQVVVFGAKTSTGIFQELLVHQLTRIALVASAGPIALASYSRYATVIRQIARAVERMTQVIPPMTSGLVGLGREKDVAELSVKASNAAVLALLPMVVIFGVLGDDLVRVWMGPEFVVPGLSWVLALMAFLHADRGVVTRILSGLNAHGRIAAWCLAASLVVFVTLLALLYPVTPLTAGVLVAVTMGVGVSLPHFLLSTRKLGIGYFRYFLDVYFKALISNVIFLSILLLAQDELRQGEWLTAATWAGIAGLALVILYWTFAFDARMRERLCSIAAR